MNYFSAERLSSTISVLSIILKPKILNQHMFQDTEDSCLTLIKDDG
jgi:hypothetical protein